MSEASAAPRERRVFLFALLMALYLVSLGLSALDPFGYVNASGLRDLGHSLVPALLPIVGDERAELLLWLGTLPLELFFAAIALVVLLRGTGARLALCLYGMYLLHWICRLLTTLTPPDHIVWDFPDWVMTFGRPGQLDLWFSGHVANAFVIALATRGSAAWLQALAWTYLAFEIWLVLALRVHYTIDVVGGLFVAYVFHRVSLDLQKRTSGGHQSIQPVGSA